MLADFREEGWPSMDLSADLLASAAAQLPNVDCVVTRPRLWRLRDGAETATGVERALGRFVQYPWQLLTAPPRGHFFHVVDHSYGHLVHLLPRGRTGVYCHDLDAFQDALRPDGRPLARQMLSRLLMSGLRAAAVVFYSTDVVRQQLLERRLVNAQRLVHAPFGVSDDFGPAASALDSEIRTRVGAPFLLNVGSCIPRKNVEFLLQLFAELRRESPDLRLVQIGGAWTTRQQALLDELGVSEAVLQMRGLSRLELAAYYRQARAVVLPTLAEGFGLPLTEALACGATVVASRLPVLQEVGGDAARYATVNDLDEWVGHLGGVLAGAWRADAKRCSAQASRYSWAEHARIVVEAYTRLGTTAAHP